MKPTVSIAIPSKTEKFLNNTIRDVLEKATGSIEIYPILDGYEPEELVDDLRVHYIRLPRTWYPKKRQGINQMVSESNGEYVCWMDAHCMVSKGFDEQLIKDHQPNWVQIPRRHRLDAENWCLQTQVDKRPPIDYEYTMWPLNFTPTALHGFKWDARTRDRADIKLDETMHFQGSFVFMTRDYFHKLGLMEIDGYQGWGSEAEEIMLKVFRDGGKCMSNSNCWYAHLHKGPRYGRMYHLPKNICDKSNTFCYDYWVNQNWDIFEKYVERFMPVPGWPPDWREQLLKRKEEICAESQIEH
jgi:hypothetical protein